MPPHFGGKVSRDSHVEMCRVVETLAEWHLPVGMYTKIITAVALRPIALRASEEAKREVLPLFAGRDSMVCGFASTEPGCGSAMSAMGTTFEEVEGGYRIRGRKHWQGFSATAQWWLVSAKNDTDGRRYRYFLVKRSEGFRTIERYEPLGMHALDYGLNEIDAVVPKHRKIDAEDTNLSAMVEMLMPPRAMMAALACGFLRRINREAHAYADNRPIGPHAAVGHRFRPVPAQGDRDLGHDLRSAQPLSRHGPGREGRHDRGVPGRAGDQDGRHRADAELRAPLPAAARRRGLPLRVTHQHRRAGIPGHPGVHHL